MRRCTIAFVVFLTALLRTSGVAQTPALSLRVTSRSGSHPLVMFFGNDNRATYGIDKELGETEGPPLSPSLDVRWMSRRKEISYGFGLLRNDFIPCATNAEQKDTFLLLVSVPDGSPGQWSLEWDRNEMSEQADSMFLVVRDSTTTKIDMLRSDSAALTNDNGTQRVSIYKYGGCQGARDPEVKREHQLKISPHPKQRRPRK